MTTVNIEIDGKKLQVDSGSMVIEAADQAGIYIPRFCYHKKLSIAANCRMCLVQVEKAAKPLPACATPVTDGMKVHTRSPKAIDAQKGVMEFLLINHPLDCPVCDQGGECELQDLAVGFGKDVSFYSENKRVVKSKNLGPLVSTDMTRCIHCTRCVRFGEEIAGIRELGATGRGEHMEIGTYIEASMDSELSGNVIDLCPVGALTSKPFRFKARAWEMTQLDTVAPHDCIGSNLHVHVRNNQVMRVVPRENEAINETWISDRDRFSYEALNSQDRLTTPMIKVNGVWQATDWNTALENVVRNTRKIIDQDGAGQLGCLASPSATTEELYLAQQLLRGLGSNNIDHRLRQLDFSDEDLAPAFPGLGQSIAALETVDAALLIGSNIRKDQPIAAHRLRKAAMRDAAIMFVNPVNYDFHFPVAANVACAPDRMVAELGGIVKALLALTAGQAPPGLTGLLDNIETTPAHRSIAGHLNRAGKATVLMGNYAHAHPHFTQLRALAGVIASLSDAALGYLTEGANSAGAWPAGAVPHRSATGQAGMNAADMLRNPRKSYWLLGVEPELDCANAPVARAAMQAAEYVVALTLFRNASLEASCDVLLPIAAFAETSGTYVNAEGVWQSFAGAVKPVGDARPAWKVLRVLGNLFGIDGFDYMSSEEVLAKVRAQATGDQPDNRLLWRAPGAWATSKGDLIRIAEVPVYAVDSLVRYATSLQQTRDAANGAIYINSILATRFGLAQGMPAIARQGKEEVTLPVVIDNRLADNSVLIYAGIPGSVNLLSDLSPLTLHKA